MKKSFGILIIVLLLSVFCVTAQNKLEQTKPDLSGTWVLDKKASGNYARSNYDDYTLKISANGKEVQMKITKDFKNNDTPVEYALTLFTDKSGEKNTIPFNSKDLLNVKSETYWRKNQLYRDYYYFSLSTYAVRNENFNSVKVSERYVLSEDGEKLTIYSHSAAPPVYPATSKDDLPIIPITTKLVFYKTEG